MNIWTKKMKNVLMSFATFGIFFYLHFIFIFQGPSKIMKSCCSTTAQIFTWKKHSSLLYGRCWYIWIFVNVHYRWLKHRIFMRSCCVIPIMSYTRFRVNLNYAVAWMSRNSIVKTVVISEVWKNVTGFELTITQYVIV